ncbi:unnamed protein product, partial [Cylicostephanus goldi]
RQAQRVATPDPSTTGPGRADHKGAKLSAIQFLNVLHIYLMTFREERFRQTSESTNSRVLWWSVGQTLVLVLTETMAARRFIKGLTSPWSLGFSGFGIAYGLYHIWDSTQSGTKYDLHENLAGKTYIVTGATSGIGQVIWSNSLYDPLRPLLRIVIQATVEELAKRNARVIMACRNREKCIQVRRDIVLSTRNKQVYCRQCDLEDFDSVRTFVQKASKGKYELDRIDGVVHNAAMMDAKRKVNKDGIERTLATNHLGAFLLTGLLLDKLLAQDHRVRIVFLNTNIINRKCDIDFDDLNAEHRKKYDGFEVYKQSKLAAAMFAKELSE